MRIAVNFLNVKIVNYFYILCVLITATRYQPTKRVSESLVENLMLLALNVIKLSLSLQAGIKARAFYCNSSRIKSNISL